MSVVTGGARRPVAWVLNFDAERELEANGAPSMPTAAVRARQMEIAKLVMGERALVRPGDLIVDAYARGVAHVADAARYVGDAWCPTPSARAALTAAGVAPRPAPAFEVLRRVNGRAFSAALGQTLPGAVYVRAVDDAVHAIAGHAVEREWLLKRPFGFAGRGRRKVHAGALSSADRAWVEASFGEGKDGLQIEPWVMRAGDFALHGFIDASSAVTLGAVTTQLCDAQGAWRGTKRAGARALTDSERESLVVDAHASARALASEGYFGPFGIDAFRWRDGRDGAGTASTSFNPRSEINARYSMGWATGMNGALAD